MIKKAYATVCGLHFALLQFGYLLLLQMDVSSTYLTYMIVSLAWIGGTLLGLWWKNLNPMLALTVGIISYDLSYILLISYPFRDFVLPLAFIGIMLTGLWAGRFFVVLLPLFAQTNQLFLLENNGFIIGIIGIFLGFSFLGIGFMLWAPLATTAFLLIHAKWLAAQQHLITTMELP